MAMIRNILTVIVMTVAGCLAASAQSNAKATVKAAEVVIKKYMPKYTEPIMDEFCDKFKKSPEVAVGIGDAYLYRQRDTAMAKKYLNRALKIDSKYAPAYLLGGRICESVRDTVGAVDWYERGIFMDTKAPDCYLAYAKLMSIKAPEKAQRKIEDLLTHKPDFPINLELARMYARVGDNTEDGSVEQTEAYMKCIDYFDRCDLNTLSQKDISDYATTVHLKSTDYEKCDKIIKFGVKKFPEYGGLYYLGVQNSFKQGNWSDAVEYGEEYIHTCDSTKIKVGDYTNLANAYRNAKRYADAIKVYKSIIDNDKFEETSKSDARQGMAICHAYSGDWGSAIREYKAYADKKRELGTVTFGDLSAFAGIYGQQAVELNGEEKLQAFRNADAIYKEIAEKFPNNMVYALYQRLQCNWRINGEDFDNDTHVIADQLVSVVLAKNENTTSDNNALKYAYKYLGLYNIKKKKTDLNKAGEYFQKILNIDPDDEDAQRYFEARRR